MKRVTVRLAPTVAAVVDNRDIPDICLQHMVAVMLLDKTVSFHAAHDKPRMQDPATLRQRAKVNLVRDDELAKLLPVRVTVVDIEFTDGTRLSERVSAVRGTPRNPMTRAEVIDKATRSHRTGAGTRKVEKPDRYGARDRKRHRRRIRRALVHIGPDRGRYPGPDSRQRCWHDDDGGCRLAFG